MDKAARSGDCKAFSERASAAIVDAQRVEVATTAAAQLVDIFNGLIELSDRNIIETKYAKIEPALMKCIAMRGRYLANAIASALRDDEPNVRELRETVRYGSQTS